MNNKAFWVLWWGIMGLVAVVTIGGLIFVAVVGTHFIGKFW